MKKRIFFQLVLPLLCLFLLVALLAFAPTWSRRQPALLEMSVILRESGGFANARQGMEQAAADLNVELRFLVPSADNSAAEQAQLLSHEVEANASAILLIPADREALAESVRAAASRAVLVTLETGMAEQGARACVGTDNAALGQALGQAVLNGVPSGGTVLLLHSAPGDNAVQERLEAASAVLTGAGRKVAVQDAGGLDFQDALSRRPVDGPVPGGIPPAVRRRFHSGHRRRPGAKPRHRHRRPKRLRRRLPGCGDRRGAGPAPHCAAGEAPALFHSPAGDHVRPGESEAPVSGDVTAWADAGRPPFHHPERRAP